jgi:hypothetical protein
MRNFKSISILKAFLQNSSHFSGILAYVMVHTKTSNGRFSNWDSVYRQVYLWVKYPENFNSKESLSHEMLKSQKTENSNIFRGIWVTFDTLISRKRNILWSWNFQSILLTKRFVREQNLRSRCHHSISWYMTWHKRKFQ